MLILKEVNTSLLEICLFIVLKMNIKENYCSFALFSTTTKRKNFLEFKTGMGKDSDDDDEIYSGMYLGHGEWDTASGFEEAEYNDDD